MNAAPVVGRAQPVMTDRPTADEPRDDARRALLRRSAWAVGGIGAAAAALPFVESLAPSERARAFGGPVDVELASLAPGELRTVAWRGKPVWLLRRTPAMIAALRQPLAELADPQSRRSLQPASCVNPLRSLRPEYFVAIGVCTHLGCSPTLRLDDAALQAELHAPGGFVCPCHGSRFDLAGRVVRNVPAPTNLEIPAHGYLTQTRLRIG